MTSLETHLARGSSELAELAPIVGWAFGTRTEDALKWLLKAGAWNVRIARDAGRVVGGLTEVPMGQWFGARSVKCLGLAGVAIDAESRGRGYARALLVETLREARARGFALSALYPATVTLYRRVGYELAGSYHRFSLPLAECPRLPSELLLEPIALDQVAAIEAVYREAARSRPGYLDRGAYVWERVRMPAAEAARGVLVRGARGVEGYVYLRSVRASGEKHELSLSDFVALTPDALARLLTFLADHRSTASVARWYGGVGAALLGFPERVVSEEVDKRWMLRIVDVALALGARGYPPIDTDLELWVEDDVLPENAGRYRLRLADGQPTLDRGGSKGGVAIDARSLAALYTGFLSAAELARAGRIQADARALARLDAVFGGLAPSMCDFF